MKYILNIFLLFLAIDSLSQSSVRGKVSDPKTGETIIGASVIYAPGKGTTSDIEGNFLLPLPNGDYTIVVSATGYKTSSKQVKLNNNNIEINFTLSANTLREV